MAFGLTIIPAFNARTDGSCTPWPGTSVRRSVVGFTAVMFVIDLSAFKCVL